MKGIVGTEKIIFLFLVFGLHKPTRFGGNNFKVVFLAISKIQGSI